MRRLAIVVALICLASGIAPAHGKQMLGTVVKLSDNQITIETKSKETKVVKLTPETTFLKSGTTARVQDLKIGERVVIHYKEANGELMAMEVIFGPTKAKSAKKAN